MKNIVPKLLIALIAFIICFIIVELVLRTFYPIYLAGNINFYEYHEKLGFHPKHGFHFYKTTDFQAEYLTNQYGTINFQDTFDEYNILVFALGDSFTEGAGLGTHHQH